MAQITRLISYSNGSIIDAGIHNGEHDLFVNGINDNDTRITALESGNMTITGNKTFNGSIQLATTLAVTGNTSLTGNLSVGGTLSVTGQTTLSGNVLISTAPTQSNHAANKDYVDSKFGVGQSGYISTAAPVYANGTQFSVERFTVRDSGNTSTITKATSTTVDITTTGLNGNAQSGAVALLGTVSVTASSNVISGTNTSFLSDFQVGDVISVTGSECRRIITISSNTSMTAESNFVNSATNAAYYRGGNAPNTFYNLYAISDGTNNGLILSTRNVANGDTLSDLPGSINTVSSMDASTDTIATTANHNLRAGLAVSFKDGGSGALPSGLAFNTTYYVSIVSSTTFKIHTTQNDALSGSNAIDITGNKSGIVAVVYESYTSTRQLPFCIKTDAGTTAPVIQPFFVANGWPYRPLIIFNTNYDDTNQANTVTSILSGGVSVSFADVDASAWVPAISRQALIWHWGTAIRVSLRAKGSPSTTGIPRLQIANNSYELLVDTDSTRTIQYKNSAATAVNLAVRGFVVTQVS